MAIWTFTPPVAEVQPFPLSAQVLKAHHTLIAGTTGCGKSTFLQTVLYAAHLLTPCDNQFLYCDLKRVELYEWSFMPHCMAYDTDADVFCDHLEHIINLMEERLDEMQRNRQKETTRGHIYVVVDETAELFAESSRAFGLLSKIMRLGRCAHIHVIMCTQSPNRGKGGGLPAGIRQNVTLCIALHCQTSIESRQVIGEKGAEKLPDHGECIVLENGRTRHEGVGMQEPEDLGGLQDYWIQHPGRRVA